MSRIPKTPLCFWYHVFSIYSPGSYKALARHLGRPCETTVRVRSYSAGFANDFIVPFVVTVVATSLFSAYMLFDPGTWLADLMVLTPMSLDFKAFLLILALGGFACSWIAERRVFLWLARVLGKIHDKLWPHRRKKRKEYKLLLEEMRM